MQNFDNKPKVVFESKETYEEALRLSQSKAFFTDESKNPIHKFIPGSNKRSQSALTHSREAYEKVNKSQEKPNLPVFYTSFKKMDCADIKAKVLKDCPIKDPYNPASRLKFRDSQPPIDKPLLKVFFLIKPTYKVAF